MTTERSPSAKRAQDRWLHGFGLALGAMNWTFGVSNIAHGKLGVGIFQVSLGVFVAVTAYDKWMETFREDK